jgi:uncharacterized protein YceK
MSIKHRFVKAPLFLLFTLLLSSCGTVMSVQNGGLGGDGRWGGDDKTILIYSGIAADLGFVLWRGEFLYLLDMPFSFAADTVLLPYTVSATLMGQNTRKNSMDNE